MGEEGGEVPQSRNISHASVVEWEGGRLVEEEDTRRFQATIDFASTIHWSTIHWGGVQCRCVVGVFLCVRSFFRGGGDRASQDCSPETQNYNNACTPPVLAAGHEMNKIKHTHRLTDRHYFHHVYAFFTVSLHYFYCCSVTSYFF